MRHQEWLTQLLEARLSPLVCGDSYLLRGNVVIATHKDEWYCQQAAETIYRLLVYPRYNGIGASIGNLYRDDDGFYCQEVRVWKSLSQP